MGKGVIFFVGLAVAMAAGPASTTGAEKTGTLALDDLVEYFETIVFQS